MAETDKTHAVVDYGKHVELVPTKEYNALVSEWLTEQQRRRNSGLALVGLEAYMNDMSTS